MILQFGFGPALSLALAHSLWQVGLLAVLAAVSLALLRSHRAAVRHAVAMGWMAAMLVAPLMTLVSYRDTPTTIELAAGEGDATVSMDAALELLGLSGPSPVDGSAPWLHLAHAWLAGVLVMLALRFGGGWRLLRRIENQPYLPLPPDWQRRFEQLHRALGVKRAVMVRLAETVVAPFTARMFRPIVWLPETLLSSLPVEQVTALLAHELAHIRRFDWLWNGLQCVIESLLFYHPAMWWLSRRIRQEREQACDDLAVGACGDGLALAEALATLHRQQLRAPQLVLSSHGGSLLKRISHLLSEPVVRPNWRGPALLVLLLSSGSLLAMQTETPVQKVAPAASDQAWKPGSVREFNVTDAGGKHLYYRVGMDAQGRMYEVFKENGMTKPVTPEIRARLHALNVAVNLPAGAVLGPPASPDSPPSPVSPPSPEAPDQTASEEFKQILKLIQDDGRLDGLAGKPYALDPASFNGEIKTWGLRPQGAADFNVAFAGPQGRVRVHYQGMLDGGSWKTSAISLARETK